MQLVINLLETDNLEGVKPRSMGNSSTTYVVSNGLCGLNNYRKNLHDIHITINKRKKAP